MEENRAARRPGELLVLAGKPSQLEWLVRNSGFRLHYLYSQIRRNSSGGNGSASSFANAADVQGTNVLVRTRHLRWWNKWYWISAPALTTIVVLLFFSVTGCESKRVSLERRYDEARLLFQQYYTDQPLLLAEAGYRESASYPDLNWKFRILVAEARSRKDQFDAALEILQPDPPSYIPSE